MWPTLNRSYWPLPIDFAYEMYSTCRYVAKHNHDCMPMCLGRWLASGEPGFEVREVACIE